jgi:hypothetical protein
VNATPDIFCRCSKCKREFDACEGAENCENGHLAVKSARAASYTVKPYPYTVEVTLSNGELRLCRADDPGG